MGRIRLSSRSGRHRSIDSICRLMGMTGDTNTKGNKGKGAARRRLKVLLVLLVFVITTFALISSLAPEDSKPRKAADQLRSRFLQHGQQQQQQADGGAYGRHPKARGGGGYEPPRQTNRRMMMRQRNGDDDRQRGGYQHEEEFSKQDKIKHILMGNLNLVDIQVRSNEMEEADEDTYEGVYATFCHLNFSAHKEDPSGVPMFRDLIAHSPMCSDNAEDWPENPPFPPGRVTVDLKKIAQAARAADEDEEEGMANNLELSGVVFHESRCGSTLVANSLIGMNPAQHRVYSESQPPLYALGACGPNYGLCSVDQAAQIVQDVIYLMGRSSNDEETRYFFKVQSAGTRSLEVFRAAFPETPWMFVYRDPVQVMMSHFAHGEKSANCLGSRRNPHPFVRQLANQHNRELQQLSSSEFCAAHLATLTETALSHIQDSDGLGRAVNYVSLPDALYEEILPAWGVDVSDEEIDNIKAVSSVYSKGRKQHKDWKEDSEQKQHDATPEIQDAAREFMQESYDQLEKISKE